MDHLIDYLDFDTVFWTFAAVLVAVMWATRHAAIPLIVDTDIGDDQDDALAVCAALALHRVGVVKILAFATSGKGAHVERGRLILSLQRDMLGRAVVPVILGNTPGESNRNYMSSYTGEEAPSDEMIPISRAKRWLYGVVTSQQQKTLVLCIGPPDNLHFLDLPQNLIRLCLMGGCFGVSFDGASDHIAEYNVRNNVEAWRRAIRMDCDIMVVPLDAAGTCRLRTIWPDLLDRLPSSFRVMYEAWYASNLARDGNESRILRGTTDGSSPPSFPGVCSAIQFDASALFAALHPHAVLVEDACVSISDDGVTRLSSEGAPRVRVVKGWADPEGFEHWIHHLFS